MGAFRLRLIDVTENRIISDGGTAITDSISSFRLSMLRLASLPGAYVRKAADSGSKKGI